MNPKVVNSNVESVLASSQVVKPEFIYLEEAKKTAMNWAGWLINCGFPDNIFVFPQRNGFRVIDSFSLSQEKREPMIDPVYLVRYENYPFVISGHDC